MMKQGFYKYGELQELPSSSLKLPFFLFLKMNYYEKKLIVNSTDYYFM